MDYIYKYGICINKVRNKLQHFHKPGVSIIMATNKAKYLDNIYNNFIRSNYKTKELIIILNNNEMNKKDYDNKFKDFNNVTIFEIDENVTLGECLNLGVNQAKYDYVAKMDDDDYYGANYLLDSMNVFEYTDAQITSKGTHFVYFEETNTLTIRMLNIENRYTFDCVLGGTFLIKKSVFDKIQFRNINQGEDTQFVNDCNARGIKIFAGDRYNYVYIRHKNVRDHTWKISEWELLRQCQIISKTSDFESYTVI